jgi:hypothetical protein
MLQQYCTLYIYGPKENESEISPVLFDNKLSFVDVVRIFNPDIVLLPEKAIVNYFFERYGSLNATKDIPKISIEVDYYNILNDITWYQQHGINFIVNRGAYSDSDYNLPHVWLPWSAHDMFYTDETSDYLDNRIDKIAFVGGGRYSRNKYYKTRQKAIRMLEERDLIDDYGSTPPLVYKELLSKYITVLGCNFAGLRHVAAKTFEIMASGALLLTTEFGYEDVLFGNKYCFLKYKEDCSNLLELIRIYCSDRVAIKHITKNALTIINNKHLHKHRIVELYNILVALNSGKEVPKKWGI